MEKKILEQELKLAEEMLVDAKILFAQDRTRSAVNRAYYAIFHAANALLLKHNIKTKKHAGAISMFGSEIVKPGLVDKKFWKYFNRAYNLRQTSDYDSSESIVMEEESEETVKNAEEFVNEMKRIVGV